MGQSRRPADRKATPARLTRLPRAGSAAAPVGAGAGVILLSGFEPFGGERLNPSWEVARALAGERIADLEVVALRLPVAYRRAPAMIARAIVRHRPAIMLSLGQAGGRAAISLERAALNLMDDDARDNSGTRIVDRPVAPAGPAAYFSRLPLRGILRALDRRHIPCALSLNAGSYLCNAVMYAALHELREDPAVPCGFLHLPYDTRQAARHRTAPAMPLGLMVEAVRIALSVIGSTPAS